MKSDRAYVMAIAIALMPRVADACPICFGAADSTMMHGARIGVMAMAAVTLGVLGALGRWLLKLRRLQGGPGAQ